MAESDKKHTGEFLTAAGLSLLITVALLALLPALSGRGASTKGIEELFPVNITNIKPLPPPPEEKAKEKEPPPPPLEAPPPMRISPEGLDIKVGLTAPRIEIDPRLIGGVPIALGIEAVPYIPTDTYNMNEVDTPPLPLIQIKPDYPYTARRSNSTGTVAIMFLVDDSGAVSDIRILRAEPPGIFEQSVLDSVRRWRFQAGTIKGKKVSTWVTTTIRFDLD